MTPNLTTFLAELYELDPTLKTHEAELLPIIEKLMKSDPAVSPDQTFIDMLRVQLRERSSSLTFPPSMSLFQKCTYLFGGAITATVLILAVVFRPVGTPSVITDHTASNAPLFPYMIHNEGKKAFGTLKTAQPESAAMQRPQSGGGGSPAPAMGMAGGGGGGNATMDSKMIAPYPMTQYTYVYSGELADLADSVDVFKHDPSLIKLNVNAIAHNLNLGTVDLSSFSDATVDSLNITQNVPFGYSIYISLHDGTVGINQQWDQWPQSKCQTDACFQSERVKAGDVPSDDALITLATTFAKNHGIDLSHYGDPFVDSSFAPIMRPMAGEEISTMPAFFPDSKRIVFPLLVDGKETYDQSGMKTGISMGINLTYKRVSDVNGISSQTYRKSSYAGVTDASLIQKFIGQIDSIYGVGDPALDIKKVTVTLGTPSIGLVNYYRYANNMNEELLVPSLIFPIENVEGDQPVYRQNVVVPLAQDLLNEQFNQPQPMPLMMEGAPPANVKSE